jgi:hypothetical protein
MFPTNRLRVEGLSAKLDNLGPLPKMKPLNPRELALVMQEERRKALGTDASGSGATPSKAGISATKMMKLDAESAIYTAQAPFRRCSDAHQYVHNRPPALPTLDAAGSTGQHNAAAKESFLTCVLADGTKAYLYKHGNNETQSTATGLTSPAPAPRATTAASISTLCKSLLSKPMSELMQEADALKVKSLLLKETLLAEKAERDEKSGEPALFQSQGADHDAEPGKS